MDRTPKPHARRLVLLLWVLVAFFYFYISYDYIRASMNDDEFAEYLQYVVRIAGTDHRPPKEVRELILIKAGDLGIPVGGEQIHILGEGETLNVEVAYHVDIQVPVFERGIYTKQFVHKVQYKRPN